MPDLNTYDFLISDENEVMLVMYAHNTEPDIEPVARLHPEDRVIELFRSETEALTLENVDDDVFKNLQKEEKLLVCELNPQDSENEEEAEIVYAYEALIVE